MKDDKKRQCEKNTKTYLQHTDKPATPSMITVDYEAYQHLLDDDTLSEDERREYLQAIWNIVVEFVSLGFEVHPLQQAQKARGKPGQRPRKPALSASDMLYLDDQYLRDNFNEFADLETETANEGVIS
ncbi:MAG: hypothetical protein AAFW83_09060 [Pseudomonadota bacterium]